MEIPDLLKLNSICKRHVIVNIRENYLKYVFGCYIFVVFHRLPLFGFKNIGLWSKESRSEANNLLFYLPYMYT